MFTIAAGVILGLFMFLFIFVGFFVIIEAILVSDKVK